MSGVIISLSSDITVVNAMSIMIANNTQLAQRSCTAGTLS